MSKILEPDRKYVCGFMFDTDGDVLLIEKVRPDWQAGKLNGIDGRIEDGESGAEAMRREFLEETGIDHGDWRLFCVLKDARGWPVLFYCAEGSIENAINATDEIPWPCRVDDLPDNVIPNLRWLIPMALSMKDEKIDWFGIQECVFAEPVE